MFLCHIAFNQSARMWLGGGLISFDCSNVTYKFTERNSSYFLSFAKDSEKMSSLFSTTHKSYPYFYSTVLFFIGAISMKRKSMSKCHHRSFVKYKWTCWIELMHFQTKCSHSTFSIFHHNSKDSTIVRYNNSDILWFPFSVKMLICVCVCF